MANTSTGRTARLSTRIRPETMARLKAYAAGKHVSEAAAVDGLLDAVLPPAPKPVAK